MTDLPSTARFALPLLALALALAQKEVTHNKALTLRDALVQPAVEAGPQAAPPVSPAQSRAGSSVPVHRAWDGEDGGLALWTAGGWRFVAARAHADTPAK